VVIQRRWVNRDLNERVLELTRLGRRELRERLQLALPLGDSLVD